MNFVHLSMVCSIDILHRIMLLFVGGGEGFVKAEMNATSTNRWCWECVKPHPGSIITIHYVTKHLLWVNLRCKIQNGGWLENESSEMADRFRGSGEYVRSVYYLGTGTIVMPCVGQKWKELLIRGCTGRQTYAYLTNAWVGDCTSTTHTLGHEPNDTQCDNTVSEMFCCINQLSVCLFSA